MLHPPVPDTTPNTMRNAILLSSVVLVASACGIAATGPASDATAAEPNRVAADAFELDPQHSHVLFEIGHLGISKQYGRFRTVSGNFTLGAEDSESSVSIEIDAASIDTNVQQRDDHVKSPDFFDVKQYPKITFASTSVKSKGDDTFAITGDLTFHGVTKSITFDMEKLGEGTFDNFGHRAGFAGSFTIDRADYGVTAYDGMVGGEVELMLAVEGMKK